MQDFLRNNRGINDGADLPEEYMSKLYDNIVNDEIKMKVSTSPFPRACKIAGGLALISRNPHCTASCQ